MPKSPKRKDLDRLVQSTLDDMHVPAGLRKIATENLLRMASEKGEDDLGKISDAARTRKLRVKAWLSSRAPSIIANKKREVAGPLPFSQKVQGRYHKEFWSYLLKQVRSASELSARHASWIVPLQEAVDLMSTLRADRPDMTNQVFKRASVLLEHTIQETDFVSAPQQVKGAIFAEAANLCAVCSWVDFDAGGMGKSLAYYRHAASIFSRERAPQVLAFVQLNRLQALTQYGDMISGSHLRAFEYDVLDASEFVSTNAGLFSVAGADLTIDLSELLVNARKIEEFVRTFRPKQELSLLSVNIYKSNELEGDDLFSINCSTP